MGFRSGHHHQKIPQSLVTLEVPSLAALSIECNSMRSLHVLSKP